MADVFVVTGVLDSLKRHVKRLDDKIMGPADENAIDWETVIYIAQEISDNADILINEAEEEAE